MVAMVVHNHHTSPSIAYVWYLVLTWGVLLGGLARTIPIATVRRGVRSLKLHGHADSTSVKKS